MDLDDATIIDELKSMSNNRTGLGVQIISLIIDILVDSTKEPEQPSKQATKRKNPKTDSSTPTEEGWLKRRSQRVSINNNQNQQTNKAFKLYPYVSYLISRKVTIKTINQSHWFRIY